MCNTSAMVATIIQMRTKARRVGFGSICKAGTPGCPTYTENDGTAIGKKA
jgi:hypothetical protein